jgi:hypothetical protein
LCHNDILGFGECRVFRLAWQGKPATPHTHPITFTPTFVFGLFYMQNFNETSTDVEEYVKEMTTVDSMMRQRLMDLLQAKDPAGDMQRQIDLEQFLKEMGTVEFMMRQRLIDLVGALQAKSQKDQENIQRKDDLLRNLTQKQVQFEKNRASLLANYNTLEEQFQRTFAAEKALLEEKKLLMTECQILRIRLKTAIHCQCNSQSSMKDDCQATASSEASRARTTKVHPGQPEFVSNHDGCIPIAPFHRTATVSPESSAKKSSSLSTNTCDVHLGNKVRASSAPSHDAEKLSKRAATSPPEVDRSNNGSFKSKRPRPSDDDVAGSNITRAYACLLKGYNDRLASTNNALVRPAPPQPLLPSPVTKETHYYHYPQPPPPPQQQQQQRRHQQQQQQQQPKQYTPTRGRTGFTMTSVGLRRNEPSTLTSSRKEIWSRGYLPGGGVPKSFFTTARNGTTTNNIISSVKQHSRTIHPHQDKVVGSTLSHHSMESSSKPSAASSQATTIPNFGATTTTSSSAGIDENDSDAESSIVSQPQEDNDSVQQEVDEEESELII